MVNAFLVRLSEQHWLAHAAMKLGIFRRAAMRYVAGETEDAGIEAAKRLNAKGIAASLDVLGERVRTEAEARAAEKDYAELLDRIAREKLDANIAIKLTHLGLDTGEALCERLLASLLARAKRRRLLVHIDMESSRYTSRTLTLYRKLRPRHPNLGITLQAYLYRTPEDLRDLLSQKGPHVIRLVKGVYAESAAIAMHRPEDIHAAYAHLAHTLFRSKNARPAIATHDGRLVRACKAMVFEFKRTKNDHEFQLLYGVKPEFAESLVKSSRVRVYVPFGREWYPYWMRRAAELPRRLREIFRR